MSPILKPGMTTSNKMIINKIPNVLSVPLEAIFEKNGKKIVYVKNGSGFDEHFVDVGEKGENSIIVKKGLENNEEVALQDPTIETEEDKANADKSVKIPKTEL
jgi:hypothetical protein